MLFSVPLFSLFMIHIAAADPGDRTVFRRELLADFQYFFLVHYLHFLFQTVTNLSISEADLQRRKVQFTRDYTG